MSGRIGKQSAVLPLTVIVAIGAVLRLLQIDQAIVADETWTQLESTFSNFGDMLHYVRGPEEITPPLFTSLVWLSGKVSDAPTILRVTSLVSGVLTIPLVYAIGIRGLGRRTALLAAGLVALSPFLAYFSIELRAYSLAVMLTAASTLAMLLAIDRANEGRGATGWWIAYAAASCLAMYTHYTCAYVLGVQLIWLLIFHPPARRPALFANVGAAIVFLPWVPSLLDDLDAPSQDIIGTLAPLNLHNGIDFTARFAFGNPGLPLGGFLGPVAEIALFGGLAVALAGWVANRGAAEGRPPRDRIVLFAVLALAAPVGVLFVSIVGDDQFLPRNLATSAPGLLLTIAALIMAGTRLTRWISAVLVIGAFGWGAIANLQADNQRIPYDEAAEVLDAEAAPGDVVIDLNPVAGGQNGAPLTPAARELDIALEKPHTVVDGVDLTAVATAFDQAHGGRLFLVGVPFFVDGTEATLGLQGEAILSRTFSGVPPLAVRAYEIPEDAKP